MRITLPSGTPALLHVPVAPTIGLVIAPDLFGLRPLYDDLASRLASQWSMAVCVVEPFPGRGLPQEREPRLAVLPELDDAANLADLEAAADATGAGYVGLLGFCMGGMYTFKASRSERFARLVACYGMIRIPPAWRGPATAEPLDALAIGHAERVLAIIGDRDPYTPPADVQDLQATGVTVARYPEAEHAFAHDPSSPRHRPHDAADAFARTREWLLA
ncbi:MAG: dienelactone hydrolase family protein [Ilumatobacteraceae bacterium]